MTGELGNHEHGVGFEEGEDYVYIFTHGEYVVVVRRQSESWIENKNADLRFIYIFKISLVRKECDF